jgi:hypothetical protein
MRRNEATAPDIRIGEAPDELVAANIVGLQWLMNAPRFQAIVVGEDGLPLCLSCIDPRAFALHKYWLSQRSDRDPVKRRRDVMQAAAVFSVASEFLGLDFAGRDLSALPLEFTQSARELALAAARER